MVGMYSYVGSAGDTIRGFSRAVRRAAMARYVRGATAFRRENLLVMIGRRKNNEQMRIYRPLGT